MEGDRFTPNHWVDGTRSPAQVNQALLEAIRICHQSRRISNKESTSSSSHISSSSSRDS